MVIIADSASIIMEERAAEKEAEDKARLKMERRMERKKAKQQGKIDKLFFAEAMKNYELALGADTPTEASEFFKLCMIYLNKLTLDTPDKVRLLVDVTFDIWKSHHYNEKIRYMKYVQGAYTRLFDKDGVGIHYAYDFCRLAHVYITENAFDGAYEVLKLGAVSGHQADALVVISMWSLLARMGTHEKQQKEADHYLAFVCTAAPMAVRDRNEAGEFIVAHSDVQLYILYVFMAWHLKNKFLSVREDKVKEKKKAFGQFNAILIEAFNLHQSKDTSDMEEIYTWFGSSELWFGIGKKLDETSLPLVAEEAYWQAFMRDQNSRYPLECLVGCMRRTKRMHLAQHIVEEAYSYNYWNLHTRELLREVESDEGVWERYFEHEEKQIRKFQAMYRAFVIRKDFIRKLKENAARILAEEQAALEESSSDEDEIVTSAEQRDLEALIRVKCAAIMAAGLRGRLLTWKAYVHDYKRQKRHAAIKVQGQVRQFLSRTKLKKRIKRARDANFRFVECAELVHDNVKLRFLRKWMTARELMVKGRAVRLITDAMLLHGRARKFFTATSILAKMIAIQRRHSDRIVFRHWQERYATHVRKRAFYSCRFWFRGQLRRIEERRAEAEMAAQKKEVMTKFKPKPGPIYRKFLDLWREVYDARRRDRGAKAIARWMLERCAVRALQSQVVYRRRLLEVSTSLVAMKRFAAERESLLRWIINGKARKLQRCLLRAHARRYVERRREVIRGVTDQNFLNLMKVKRSRMWRWKKHTMLRRRENHRAARTLQRKLRVLSRGRQIRHVIARRARVAGLLHTFHRASMLQYLRMMQQGASIAYFIRVLTRHMDLMEHVQYRGAFAKWKRFTGNLQSLTGAVGLMERRLDRRFWSGAGDSVAFHRPFLPNGWEIPRPRTKLLMDDSHMPIARAFRSWMAAYREQHRKRRNNAYFAAKSYIDDITDFFEYQTAQAIRIQCMYRRVSAKSGVIPMRYHAMRVSEADRAIRIRKLHRSLMTAHIITVARKAARLVIQCAWRCSLARHEAEKRQDYRDLMDVETFTAVATMIQARLIRKCMTQWQMLYCTRLGAPQSSPLAANATFGDAAMSLSQDRSLACSLEPGRPNGADSPGSESTEAITPDPPSLASASLTSLGGSGLLSGLSQSMSMDSLVPFKGPPRSMKERDNKSIRRTGGASLPFDGSNQTWSESDFRQQSQSLRARAALAHSQSWVGSDMDERDRYGELDRDPTEYMGQEFHSAMFRIKQSGVFLVDTSTMTMSLREIVYCIQRSQTVFCRQVDIEVFNLVIQHFGGSKLVFCQGDIPHRTALGLLSILRDRPRSSPLSLHLGGEFKIPFRIVEHIIAMVAADVVPLSELSIDSFCFGSLGTCALLAAMRDNRTIETLLINNDHGKYLHCAVACIRKVCNNHTLRELRLLGSPIDRASTFELHTCVSYGLHSLAILEFGIDDPLAVARADAIIEVSKHKSSVGQSLSVVVN